MSNRTVSLPHNRAHYFKDVKPIQWGVRLAANVDERHTEALCPNCGETEIEPGDPVRLKPSRVFANGSLAIPFTCNMCSASMALEIGFHKGHTRIGWRVAAAAIDDQEIESDDDTFI